MSFVDAQISSSLKATTVNLISYVSRCNHVRVLSAMLSQELHLHGTCESLLPKTKLPTDQYLILLSGNLTMNLTFDKFQSLF